LARLSGLRSSAAETSSPGSGVPSWIPLGLSRLGDKIAERKSIAQKLDALLERSGGTLRPGEFVVIVMVAIVVGGALGALVGGSSVSTAVGGFVGALVPIVRTRLRVRKRLRKMQELLPDVLGILAGSLRAGHSFFQALDGVAREAPDPMNHEFSRSVAEIRLGRRVPEALDALADRIDSEDFRWALLAVNVQRDVGGNLAEILDTVAKTLRERADIRRQVRVLSSESRLSAYILSVLPFGVGGYLYLLSPETTSQLFTTGMGRMMVAGASVLMLFGFVWMRKLVKIDV
ncbi:MAG: type II secretion system F family protein, partial [Actinomycetota bacterium]